MGQRRAVAALQLDLPVTPVTDIRLHRQDLVISTMGRAFWILDNVTPLHQIADAAQASRRISSSLARHIGRDMRRWAALVRLTIRRRARIGSLTCLRNRPVN